MDAPAYWHLDSVDEEPPIIQPIYFPPLSDAGGLYKLCVALDPFGHWVVSSTQQSETVAGHWVSAGSPAVTDKSISNFGVDCFFN